MLDHISLRVSDLGRSLEFYKAALAPLGYSLIMEFPGAAGFGVDGKPDFWVTQSDKPINPTHVAFRATRKVVNAFHAAGLAAGGKDLGAPGPRDYHPAYYGAFIADPDENNIEAVSHLPEGATKMPAAPVAKAKPATKKSAAKPAKKVVAPAKKKAAATKKPQKASKPKPRKR